MTTHSDVLQYQWFFGIIRLLNPCSTNIKGEPRIKQSCFLTKKKKHFLPPKSYGLTLARAPFVIFFFPPADLLLVTVIRVNEGEEQTAEKGPSRSLLTNICGLLSLGD